MKISFKSVTDKFLQALRQGTSPKMLALTIALGVVIGIFPVLGTTTLLCLGVSIMFRLNIPLMQLVNYIVAPIQLIMIIPFIKAGSYLFNLKPFAYSMDELISLFRTDFWMLVREAGVAYLIGIAVWIVAAIPLFLVIFLPSYWFFNTWKVTRYREL